MAKVEIVPAKLAHVVAMQHRLRDADAREILAAGARIDEAVDWSYRGSLAPRAALVDGAVAAMWGIIGTLCSEKGRPWLLTTGACERVSALAFARIYCAEARSMTEWFPVLENYVDARYVGAMRMLILAGFTLDKPAPYGRKGAMFRRFELRAA